MRGGPSDVEPDSTLETVFYRRERVRFVHWRQFSGARSAVVLTGLITVLTFVTGLSTLSQDVLVLRGPLAAALPDVTGLVRFAGVLLAFVLGLLTFGLHRGKRLAWYFTVGVLPFVATLPLLTLQTTHMPVLLLVLVAAPVLVRNRTGFDRPIDLSSLQIAALLSIVGVLLYGAVGSYVMRDQFVELASWGDAVYYVLVTIATVGYGDITPLTPQAKWFSLSIIVFGTGAFTAAIGALIVPAIEKRMATAFGNMTPARLNLLEDHVLVLGYSDITESVLEELAGERDVVVVTPDQDRAADLDDRDVDVLTADPTHEDRLQEARIEAASGVVVATRDDAEDVLAVLAARKANPDAYVVAAANDRHNVAKLEDVGADEVISPTTIGGRILGRSVLAESAPDALFDASGGEEGAEVGGEDQDKTDEEDRSEAGGEDSAGTGEDDPDEVGGQDSRA